MTLTLLFLRGFAIVFLTAANVVQVSHGRYLGAFVGGFLISLLWWSNAGHASHAEGWSGPVYALGAACGTVSGMWVSYWILRRATMRGA